MDTPQWRRVKVGARRTGVSKSKIYTLHRAYGGLLKTFEGMAFLDERRLQQLITDAPQAAQVEPDAVSDEEAAP
jgi:hypothetical protein